MGNFFKSSKSSTTTTLEPMKEKWQLDAGKSIGDFVQQYIKQYQPGQDFSNLSQMINPSLYENKGLNILDQYLNKGTNDTLTNAAAEVNKTLTDGYDPTTSEYYKSMRAALEKEQAKAFKDLNNQMAKYGYSQSSFKRHGMQDVVGDSFNKVSQLIGSMIENERNRKANAVLQALNVNNAQNADYTDKVNASQTYGSLPRMLAGVEYQDFLRKQNENSGVLNTAQNLLNTNIDYGLKSYTTTSKKPSMFSQVAPLIGAGAGAVFGMPQLGYMAGSLVGDIASGGQTNNFGGAFQNYTNAQNTNQLLKMLQSGMS